MSVITLMASNEITPFPNNWKWKTSLVLLRHPGMDRYMHRHMLCDKNNIAAAAHYCNNNQVRQNRQQMNGNKMKQSVCCCSLLLTLGLATNTKRLGWRTTYIDQTHAKTGYPSPAAIGGYLLRCRLWLHCWTMIIVGVVIFVVVAVLICLLNYHY